MDQVGPLRPEPILARIPYRMWRRALMLLITGFAALLVVILLANVQRPTVIWTLFLALIASVAAFVFAVTWTSRQLRREQQITANALQASEKQFRQMAANIQEIFWMIDAKTKRALYVNKAYEAITGRTCHSLIENPSSYMDVIHADDRAAVLGKLDQAAHSGHFDEKFRIVRPEGDVRWVWVRGFPVHDRLGNVVRLVGTALEITALKQAEEHVATNLAAAKSAWAEEEALRKATLALTQDLHMNKVMDALLRSLAEVVPYTCARVLVPEGGPHWLALGERELPEPAEPAPKVPWTFVDDKCALVRRIAQEKKSVLISDTKNEPDWPTFKGHKHLRSWLSVPLVASGDYLGFLSIGHAEPNRLTPQHVRRAELLALPAAAAIENARLYTHADIYSSVLEDRLNDLRAAEMALVQAKSDRRISEDPFQKVFRSSPVPFSITTLKEGKFVDVNSAFERRYGYSRDELLGHTVHELRIWEDPGHRAHMLAQLQQGGPIRNIFARLRTKSGEIKVTTYSADTIEFEGQTCILAVSEDVLEYDPQKAN